MTPTVDAPVKSEQEKSSIFEDLIDIFTSPAKVFARRLDRGVFLSMVLLTVIALVLAFANRGTMEGAVNGEIDRAIAKMMEANPEMPEAALGATRSWMSFSFTYGITIFLPIYFLCLALIAWLAGKIFGVSVTYGTALMVTTWSFAPRLIGMLAVTIQGFVMDTSKVTGIWQLTLSPARFFDPQATSAGVLGLLGRLELTLLWQTALLGIGLAVAGRVPRGKGITVAVVCWLIGSIPILFQL